MPDPAGAALQPIEHPVLFEHRGEVPEGPWVPLGPYARQVDLQERKEVLAEPGHHTVLSVERYQVRLVPLPPWLPLEEYLRGRPGWAGLWAYGVPLGWPEAWQRGLLRLQGAARLACVELLQTRSFRSRFRQDLCQQLTDWLEGRRPGHGWPFSERQLAHLLQEHHARYAERLEAGVRRTLGQAPPAPAG